MKEKATDDLIRIIDMSELASPNAASVQGRRQAGEEEQDVNEFKKAELVFPSDEPLPRCWTDAGYQTD